MAASILSLRSTLVLCAFALLLAALGALVLLPRGAVPGSGLVDLTLLPQFLTGGALLFAALGAPGIFKRDENVVRASSLHRMESAAVASAWCGVITAFMLLASARIAPIDNAGILCAAIWVAGLCWVSILLDAAFPRAALGLLFAWCVAPPVSAYMLAEIFLSSSAGSAGLAQSTAPQAAALSETLRWLLNASPGTAAIAALTESHPGKIPYSPAIGFTTLGVVAALSFIVSRRVRSES